MDIQKEKEIFDAYWEKEGCNADYEHKEYAWSAWQAAKAHAVPDTYTPIVLALEDVQSKIAQASFLTMDAENQSEVYAVDTNEISAYIDELIEAQEPK